ncbi:dTMP kinase [Kribbella sp. NPDC026596]|uniref:dTMP kinase n=1 Tax=Kribbella sp. NPDC026596 TaxID=3155122 RepID=UPI0033DE71A5
MDRPRPSSEGVFNTVDGPSGAGKSTAVANVMRLLIEDGVDVHTTSEPSAGPIGRLARALTDTVTGPALACLYAADRYLHLQTEIRPHLATGELVLCDRYVPSGLVMQRLDSVDLEFLWQLNARADRPDLTIILTADPATIATRLTTRGPHNRFQRSADSSRAEVDFYEDARTLLDRAGYNVKVLDTTTLQLVEVAVSIHQAIKSLLCPTRVSRRSRIGGEPAAESA